MNRKNVGKSMLAMILIMSLLIPLAGATETNTTHQMNHSTMNHSKDKKGDPYCDYGVQVCSPYNVGTCRIKSGSVWGGWVNCNTGNTSITCLIVLPFCYNYS